ncbi:hypothetical protein BYT27DRAFT_7152322 [Phlegmacium glaucopus]|nr:hypothetical protein BYT27DRAFT_7152322 [Phlegmacium glaucopus]
MTEKLPFLAPHPALSKPRTIICCFDGTGNKFGEVNSNVLRLFKALEKDKPDEQLVYYQPGIASYNKRHLLARSFSYIATVVDQAIALHLNDHVKEGYKYIMQNYRKGDKICLFGFSRGAYIARAVMGMLYKVGILPPDNFQQIDFAFSVYQMTGDEGRDLSREFKRTFAFPVTVEFVGVWDTVSSVGIIPRTQPYTSVNYAVKTFRHALALDERRARFRPKTWYEATLEPELQLDVDEPDIVPRGNTSRDDWVYTPLKRDMANIEEVWFSGCHADIGGGSHHNRLKNSLSFIPLRWMIKEAIIAGTGILFKKDALKSISFDFMALASELDRLGLDVQETGLDPVLLQPPVVQPMGSASTLDALLSPIFSPTSQTSTLFPFVPFAIPSSVTTVLDQGQNRVAVQHVMGIHDIISKVYDRLFEAKSWWILEIIPTITTYQGPTGDWMRKRIRNFGRGRYIPVYNNKVKVHISVERRIEDTKYTQNPYTPQAYNWDTLREMHLVQYVT